MTDNFRGAREIKVIEIKVLEGKGIEGNPYRLATYYLLPDGTVIKGEKDED